MSLATFLALPRSKITSEIVSKLNAEHMGISLLYEHTCNNVVMVHLWPERMVREAISHTPTALFLKDSTNQLGSLATACRSQ